MTTTQNEIIDSRRSECEACGRAGVHADTDVGEIIIEGSSVATVDGDTILMSDEAGHLVCDDCHEVADTESTRDTPLTPEQRERAREYAETNRAMATDIDARVADYRAEHADDDPDAGLPQPAGRDNDPEATFEDENGVVWPIGEIADIPATDAECHTDAKGRRWL